MPAQGRPYLARLDEVERRDAAGAAVEEEVLVLVVEAEEVVVLDQECCGKREGVVSDSILDSIKNIP